MPDLSHLQRLLTQSAGVAVKEPAEQHDIVRQQTEFGGRPSRRLANDFESAQITPD